MEVRTMKRTVAALILLIVLGCMFGTSYAQGEAGKFGMGIFDITSGASDFALMGKYWVTNKIAVSPRFGLVLNGSDRILLGGSATMTLSSAGQVEFYFGGTGDILILAPGDDSLILGGLLGAEYFVVPRFSVIGESKYSIAFGGDTTILTSATLSVLFYFN